ncbi:hypothetical protein GCM10010921_15960 [Microbacterium album]|uniref:MmgE/PrpD C-terminal domain-containing protein n=2 Tax=Microbacterium album TaxID=2053191 RepID=A0A917IFZ9_9MICO|nr:hypothetical protein GCM10010921_15960 [Microbacterium album]
MVGNPFKVGRFPTVDGQFSVRYAVANALLRGTPELAHFTPESVRDPLLGDLAARVDVHLDPSIPGDYLVRAQTEIEWADGTRTRRNVDHMTGSARAPLSEERLRYDFFQRAGFGKPTASREHLETVLAAVDGIEGLADVGAIPALTVVRREA